VSARDDGIRSQAQRGVSLVFGRVMHGGPAGRPAPPGQFNRQISMLSAAQSPAFDLTAPDAIPEYEFDQSAPHDWDA